MTQVRIAVLNGFEEQVQELNGDVEEILTNTRLSGSFFDDHVAEDFLSLKQIESLLSNAAENTKCPLFAIRLGLRQNMNLFGLLGYMMQKSRNIKTALSEFATHFRLHVRDVAYVETEVFGDYASLNFNTSSQIRSSRFCDELAMAEGTVILRALCGNRGKPLGINFRHNSTTRASSYEAELGVPISFNQEKTQIIFEKKLLSLPITEADPELKMILRAHIELLNTQAQQDICDQVESLIHRALPIGQCSIEGIASLMCMHRRTLHRLLKKNDSSFTILLENVRKRIAVERLENSDTSIIQLADYLGYADNSAFTRAFKRWYKVTPAQWRVNHSSAANHN